MITESNGPVSDRCNLCDAVLVRKIYDSGGGSSLTSLCTIHNQHSEVYLCEHCAHVQSTAIDDIAGYYDHSYEILTGSEEEDQIYEVVSGRRIYRTEHQVRVLRERLQVGPGTKILDYGCAKSATMRSLVRETPGLEAYLFDVSDRYRPFWDRFIPSERCATFSLPFDWQEKFDIVTSFFSLEHMALPSAEVRKVASLLKEGGIFYGVVPNFLSNIADLIVVDHVNHFTVPSLAYLLRENGFDVLEITDSAHRGALVFVARKQSLPQNRFLVCQDEMNEIAASTCRIADFWEQAGARVRAFEETLPADGQVALYGAGFYGAFIVSKLRRPQRIRYVIDQNSFLQGRQLHGAPVIAPVDLPSDITTLLVGLNPSNARQSVGDIAAFAGRSLSCFYL